MLNVHRTNNLHNEAFLLDVSEGIDHVARVLSSIIQLYVDYIEPVVGPELEATAWRCREVDAVAPPVDAVVPTVGHGAAQLDSSARQRVHVLGRHSSAVDVPWIGKHTLVTAINWVIISASIDDDFVDRNRNLTEFIKKQRPARQTTLSVAVALQRRDLIEKEPTVL